jgi:hypothetical protein
MNNLYEALEVCLESIERGMDIETSLARYTDIDDELRPIIQASMIAREKAIPVPSLGVMQRNRARLLHRAAEMRDVKVKASLNQIWLRSFRRAAVVLTVLAIVFMSGTGLVRASSTTLPGDNLYPVKRTYEGLTLLFTFDFQRRESLAVEHENARLDELHELIAIGRSARVDFAGIVTKQNGNEWLVAGIPVIVSSQTDFHDGPVFVGDAIRVFGITESNNSVLAERIDELPPDATLPDVGNSDKGSNSGSHSGSDSSNDDNGNEGANENDSSGPGNGNDNSNDNNSGPGGGNYNENNNSSGPGGATDSINENNSGSGGGNDNSNDSNSGSGSNSDSSTEDSSGSGSGSDNSNDNNSGPGGGGGDD